MAYLGAVSALADYCALSRNNRLRLASMISQFACFAPLLCYYYARLIPAGIGDYPKIYRVNIMKHLMKCLFSGGVLTMFGFIKISFILSILGLPFNAYAQTGVIDLSARQDSALYQHGCKLSAMEEFYNAVNTGDRAQMQSLDYCYNIVGLKYSLIEKNPRYFRTKIPGGISVIRVYAPPGKKFGIWGDNAKLYAANKYLRPFKPENEDTETSLPNWFSKSYFLLGMFFTFVFSIGYFVFSRLKASSDSKS